MYRADDRVVTLEKCGEAILVKHVALLRRDVRQCRDLFRIAGDRGDLVSTIGELLEDRRAGPTGSADESDMSHDVVFPFAMLLVKSR
jgi:hypothetical protein